MTCGGGEALPPRFWFWRVVRGGVPGLGRCAICATCRRPTKAATCSHLAQTRIVRVASTGLEIVGGLAYAKSDEISALHPRSPALQRWPEPSCPDPGRFRTSRRYRPDASRRKSPRDRTHPQNWPSGVARNAGTDRRSVLEFRCGSAASTECRAVTDYRTMLDIDIISDVSQARVRCAGGLADAATNAAVRLPMPPSAASCSPNSVTAPP